jgi:hypothetical protein
MRSAAKSTAAFISAIMNGCFWTGPSWNNLTVMIGDADAMAAELERELDGGY